MGSRLDLHALLLTITDNVYYQPPSADRMSYPCIVYNRSNIHTRFANNNPSNAERRYALKVLDPDPDSQIIDKVILLARCRFDRHYVSDDLNHDVFTIIF